MKKKERRCPFCGSAEVIPSEGGGENREEYSLQTVLAAAVLVFAAAISLLLVTLAISFPIVVIASVALVSRLLQRREKKQRNRSSWVCLDCERTFGRSVKRTGCIPGRKLPL